MKMQSIFPTANLRFHDALDRMEEEINMAQNILKRDLALHRIQEKQKEEMVVAPVPRVQHEKTEGQAKTADVVMTTGHDDTNQPQQPELSQGNRAPQAPSMAPTRQMEVVEPKKETQALPPAPAPQQAPQPAPIAPMVAPMVAPMMVATAAPATVLEAAPAPVSAPAAPPATQPTNTDAAEPQPSEPLATAGSIAADDADLFEFFGEDAMDTANTGDDAQLEPMGDLVDSNADVSSLLPGLESYANIPDDTAMPDVPSGVPEETPTAAAADNTDANGLPDFDFSNLSNAQAGSDAQQPPQADANGQPDFGDIDFGSFEVTNNGGNSGEQADNTFDDLFDLDQYDFGGGGGGGGSGGGGGDDINDWMKSL
jgi:hypothetical protein